MLVFHQHSHNVLFFKELVMFVNKTHQPSMTKTIRSFIVSTILILLSSCGLIGIHINVHNPKHAGKYPKFDEETIVLGESNPLRTSFDVSFYALDILINAPEKRLGGWVEIRAHALQDLDSIQLDLDQPLKIEDLRLGSREGKQLSYSRQYRAVIVKLGEKITQGRTFSIHVKYGGKPVVAKRPPWVGGLVWKKDKKGLPWAGVTCESEGASIWFPCKDVTFDEPDSASMRFTVPDTRLSVISNGTLTGLEKGANTASFNWKVSYPINLYNITFYVGNFEKVTDTFNGINGKVLDMSYYVFKEHVDSAKTHFRQVKDHIRIYEAIYGEYPWYNDGFKFIESPYEGMEHQTAIAYGNGFKNDLDKRDDYIILHETGHEWFGNAITASDLADVWLQEGITTYGESLVLERKYGVESASLHLLLYRFMIKNKFPLVGPQGRRYFNYKDGDVYVKGAWVLHSLRNIINDDSVFFRILSTFYMENRYKTTNSKMFIETVNKITDKDYKWFFDQYLYKNTAPVLEFHITSDSDMYYRWTNTGAGFNKLQVIATFGSGKLKTDGFPAIVEFESGGIKVEFYPDTKVHKIKLPEGANDESQRYFNDNKILFGWKENKKLVKLFNRGS